MTEFYPQHPQLVLVEPGHEVLRQRAEAVDPSELITDELQDLIYGMLELARGEQGESRKRSMVGLAAPQLGIAKRIIVVAIDAAPNGVASDFRAYINPEVSIKSKVINRDREGCYSTGQVCGIVSRPNQVTVTALDRMGNEVTQTSKGFAARIFQHEIDHLDGIRFPDRIPIDDDLLWVEPEEFGDFREHWNDWPKKCSRRMWQSIKSGRVRG